MNDLKKLTPAEFAHLAYTARGFGPCGRMTLVDYIAHVAETEAQSVVSRHALQESIEEVRRIAAEIRSA